MIEIFKIAPNDQSVFYLGQIFGYIGGLLPVGGASLILGTMFKVFNTMALVLGSLVVVYTTVVGLFATASEGEFLGKKWNSLWVPLRMLMGIAALFPTASGYSMLQVLMMWCILQGVGAADTLWNTVLKYVSVTGSPFAAISVPTLGTAQTMQNLYKGLLCQAEAIKTVSTPQLTAKYFCAEGSGRDPKFCGLGDQLLNVIDGPNVTRSNGVVVYTMGPTTGTGGACGTLTYCDSRSTSVKDEQGNDVTVTCEQRLALERRKNKSASQMADATSADRIACAACKVQEQSIQQVVKTLGNLAARVADWDLEYGQFYDLGEKPVDWIKNYCAANGIPEEDCCRIKQDTQGVYVDCSHAGSFYPTSYGTEKDAANTSDDAMLKIYWPSAAQPVLKGNDFIKSSVDFYTGNIVGAVTSAIADSQTSISSKDDLDAAAYNGWIVGGAYYYKIAQMNKGNLDAALPTFTVAPADPSSATMAGFRSNFKVIGKLLDAMTQAAQKASSFTSSMPPQLAFLNGNADGLIKAFMDNLTGDKTRNPLSSLQAYGEGLLVFAQIMFTVFLLAAFWIVWSGNFKAWVLGTGVDPGIGQGFTMLFFILLPLFMGFLTALFVFGGLLAVYVPLIPYILFTMSALGWIIGTVEAMVAAPLIALGILSPGGQHEILGKAEPALLLLLNVVLRPSLMIFGLVVAMLFSVVAVYLVNTTFRAVIGSILSNPGLPEFIMILAAYTFLIISVLNKCFSVIHLLPERVLTWIGGQAVTYGEEQALGEVKKGVESAAGATMGAVTGAEAQGQKIAKGQKRLQAAHDANKKDIT